MRARIGACQKKQKDDGSDDDKPLGKLKKEGAGAKRKAAVCKDLRGVGAGASAVCVSVSVYGCAPTRATLMRMMSPPFLFIFSQSEKRNYVDEGDSD
jgi:hypothetical protein